MIDSQLIMVEGLPSTGKTTNARFIHIQLERNNLKAEWIHEVAMPHMDFRLKKGEKKQDIHMSYSYCYNAIEVSI
jgi:thymidylate kinase